MVSHTVRWGPTHSAPTLVAKCHKCPLLDWLLSLASIVQVQSAGCAAPCAWLRSLSLIVATHTSTHITCRVYTYVPAPWCAASRAWLHGLSFIVVIHVDARDTCIAYTHIPVSIAKCFPSLCLQSEGVAAYFVASLRENNVPSLFEGCLF